MRFIRIHHAYLLSLELYGVWCRERTKKKLLESEKVMLMSDLPEKPHIKIASRDEVIMRAEP